MTRSALAASLSLAMFFALSGCSGIRLYSETRDKQGQTASKAWSEIDLKGFFALERENRARVLQQEILTSQRRISADRDLEIRLLASAPIAHFPCFYDRRLAMLAATTQPANDDISGQVKRMTADPCPGLSDSDVKSITKATTDARSALRRIRSFTANLEREQSFWRQEDIPIFGCVDLQAAFEGQAPTAAVPSGLVGVWLVEQPVRSRTHIRRLERAAADCHTIAKARTAYREALAAFAKGELGARVAELRRSEEALLQEQKRLSEKQGDYAKALAVYKNELAEQKQGKSSAEKVRDLAAKVEKAIDAIEDVQGFLNAKFLSEERIKRIDDLLGKLKTGKEPAEDASKVEVSIFYLPLLADDIRAIEAAEQGRSAVPLLIKRDIEQARLNGAKSVVAAKELGIELRRAAIESRLGEIQSIVDARQTFLVAPKSDSAPLGLQSLTRPFFSAWDELAERQKFALLQSVSMYLDSIGRQRAMTEKLDRTRLALASEEASSLSEVNASMWTSLIGAGVAQAAEYSALGLKASDFQGILSTLGILWIGYGTNR